jgi:hypothetical protein
MLPDDGGPDGGLFLSPVPVPQGDPGALAHAAGTYTAAQGEIDRSRSTLSGAAAQASGAAWTGTGAAAYSGATTDLATVFGLTSAALAKGATALRAYSRDLATAQHTAHQANAAVAASNGAASAFLSAQAESEQAQTSAQDAATASDTAQSHATANPHSPAAATAAQDAKNTASTTQSAATAAASRLNAASARYSSARSRAVTLCSQAQQEARQAATKAASGFDAAGTELMGQQARPAAGGAAAAPGSSPWQTVIGALSTGNNWAAPVLTSWGAFGAVLVSKAEVSYLEAQAGLGKAVDTFDGAVNDVLAGKGFYSSGFYDAADGLNGAFATRSAANADLLKAIGPAADDSGFGALLGRTGLGLGMASDAITLADPAPSFGPDHLLGGNTDRVMAGANLAASGLALGSSMDIGLATTAMAIPGVDVVVGGVLIGTATYFAGEYVYQHWGAITHGIGAAGSWAGHEADSVGHDIGKAFSWL